MKNQMFLREVNDMLKNSNKSHLGPIYYFFNPVSKASLKDSLRRTDEALIKADKLIQQAEETNRKVAEFLNSSP